MTFPIYQGKRKLHFIPWFVLHEFITDPSPCFTLLWYPVLRNNLNIWNQVLIHVIYLLFKMGLFPWILAICLILCGLQGLRKLVLDILSLSTLLIVLTWRCPDRGVLAPCAISLPAQLPWDVNSLLSSSNHLSETDSSCE